MTTEVKVARGAALLDEERPRWAEEIDTDALAMEDGDHCILGQLFPGDANATGYDVATEALGINDETAEENGFFVNWTPGQPPEFIGDEYVRLNALWRREVAKRVKEPAQV